MKSIRKKLKLIVLLCFTSTLIVSTVYASPGYDYSHSNLYLKQPKYSVTCTLVAVTNMMRAGALINGSDTNLYTPDKVAVKGWIGNVGLRDSFTYGEFEMNAGKFSYNNKENELRDLLSQHPAGIVIYKFSPDPHAILITDFEDGTFYCADPSPYFPEGRIPVSAASISVNSASKYWYISSGISPANEEIPAEEVLEYRYREAVNKTEYTTSEQPSLDGWTLVNSVSQTSQTDWSDWQSEYVSPHSGREIEEQIIETSFLTEVYIGRYYSETANKFSPSQLDESYQFEGGWFNLNDITFVGQAYSGGRNDCWTVPGYHYYFFGTEKRTISDTELQYRFRDTVTTVLYEYQRETIAWSSWSDWDEQYISEHELREVQTRTVTK